MAEKWDKSKKKSDKLLLLYVLLLFNNRGFSTEELKEYLNCSPATISRLIKDLESLGVANIEVIREKTNIYKLIRSNRIPNISLNPDGLTLLSLCSEFFVGLLPENMQQKIRTSLGQAVTYLTQEKTDIPYDIGGFIVKGKINYSPFRSIIENLIHAIQDKKICIIKYQSSIQNEPKEYNFAPKRIIIYHESLYVEGFYVNEQESVKEKDEIILTLAIQRIKSCSLTARSSSSLQDVPKPDNRAFGFIIDEPFEVKIRFSPEVATYVAEREWSENQSIEINEDNYLILKVTMNNINECISWVLSFKDNAEILEPDWLRKEVAKTILSMRRIYIKNNC
ncbi:MAG: WYL domain-containing transcriptional regulator [Desulfovibrionaceae bacterium]|nr:WYL domain-containing transcriptional regulator [Desulfovibrionaceae bacterium]